MGRWVDFRYCWHTKVVAATWIGSLFLDATDRSIFRG
jgi:hypothetical protein